jgi:hypothetical protein
MRSAYAHRPVWGPLAPLTVVATTNHYVFDIAAGLLVAGAGYAIGRLPERVAAAGARPAAVAA